MNMNYHRNVPSTDSLLNNSKAVLMEARLQRISSVSGYGNRNAAYKNLNSSSRANKNTKSRNISNKSIDVTCHQTSNRSSRRQSTSRSLFSAEAPIPHVDDILLELKQVKNNLIKDIESNKSKGRKNTSCLTDTELNSIHSFMKACDLMLESFDMQPQHDAEYQFERYEKRQSPTRRRRSCVKFDLSQNEFFSY
ncbi:predicted protein [Chaetoceros tenuissimus]|uniref:Uncharacterized protein n=1 Tax=Chaetoceros tenuissimus TaxID=426638 RepID=A0AAD3CFQ7_9STRA|nr:predicted protein [Chaetoceros tenuissimus]